MTAAEYWVLLGVPSTLTLGAILVGIAYAAGIYRRMLALENTMKAIEARLSATNLTLKNYHEILVEKVGTRPWL